MLDSDDDEPRPLVPLIDARGRSTDCPGRTPKLIVVYVLGMSVFANLHVREKPGDRPTVHRCGTGVPTR